PGVKHFAWCKVASSVPLLIWSLLLLRTLSSIQGCDFTHGNMEWEENLFMVRPLLMRTLNASILVQLRPSSSVFCTLCLNTNGSQFFITTLTTSCVREWICCTKMEADGNQ
ncbi:unnamed protein product, partial [Brassica rapa subsp. narinosa]